MLVNALFRSVLLPLADWCCAAADAAALALQGTLFEPLSGDAAGWE